MEKNDGNTVRHGEHHCGCEAGDDISSDEKRQERQLEIAEMIMLRYSLGVTGKY